MYDTVIIGKDIGSLITALILARRGQKAALVTENDYYSPTLIDGYSFTLDPSPLSGIGDGQILSNLFQELEIQLDQSTQLILMDPAIQIIMSDHRIDIHQDPQRLFDELKREFPQNRNEIDVFHKYVSRSSEYLEQWLKEGGGLSNQEGQLNKAIKIMERILLGAFNRTFLNLRGKVSSGEFNKIIQTFLFAFSNIVPERPGRYLVADAYTLSLPKRGLYYPMGGKNNWLNWLCKEFVNSGGRLIDNGSVIRIETKKGIIVDLELAGKIDTIRSDKLIISSQLENLPLLFSSNHGLKKAISRFQHVKSKWYKFSIHMGVREQCLPERITPYVLLIPNDNEKIPGALDLILIEISLPNDLTRAPVNKRAITATIMLGSSPLTISDSELRMVSQSLFKSLERLLPFLSENIDFISLDHSIGISRKYNESVPHKISFTKDPIIGTNILPQHTSLPNVFFTGSVYNAGLGFEGEILSAIKAARWALE